MEEAKRAGHHMKATHMSAQQHTPIRERAGALLWAAKHDHLSLSARGRGATCQLRPPQHSRLQRGTRGRATALAVSHEEAQHASFLRARTVLR